MVSYLCLPAIVFIIVGILDLLRSVKNKYTYLKSKNNIRFETHLIGIGLLTLVINYLCHSYSLFYGWIGLVGVIFAVALARSDYKLGILGDVFNFF